MSAANWWPIFANTKLKPSVMSVLSVIVLPLFVK